MVVQLQKDTIEAHFLLFDLHLHLFIKQTTYKWEQ